MMNSGARWREVSELFLARVRAGLWPLAAPRRWGGQCRPQGKAAGRFSDARRLTVVTVRDPRAAESPSVELESENSRTRD